MQSHRGFGCGVAAVLRFIGTQCRAIAPSRTGERHAQQLLMPVHRNHSRSGVRLIAGISVVAIIERSIAVGEPELHVLRVHAFRQIDLIPPFGIRRGTFRSGLLDFRHGYARRIVIGAVGICVIDICRAGPHRIGLVVDGERLVVDAAWVDSVVISRGHFIGTGGFRVLVRTRIGGHRAARGDSHGDPAFGDRQFLRAASRGVHIAILAIRQRGLERRGDIR